MGTKLVMNIQNEQNVKALVEWCKKYHIAYQLIEDTNPLGLVDDKVSDVVEPKKSSRSKDDKKFPNLEVVTDGKSNKSQIGNFVTVYSDIKGVRYWECGFTHPKVKYGIKKSLVEAKASWDSTLGCYTFNTKKDFDAWCKAQKNK
ncbi:MAG: hypothetical protein MJ236_04080 [Clostridia bacterium]|nr:hypothetical protein [Clostridia bacterium]